MRILAPALLLTISLTVHAQEAAFRDTLSVDGPYITYSEEGVRTITVDAKGNISDRITSKAPRRFRVRDHEGKNAFKVRLRPVRRQPWEDRTPKNRLFVMSDPHGRLDCVISLLQGNGVIDRKLRWSWGRDELVVIGDIFDRGDDAVQIFWFFYELQRQAEKAGGRVTMFLGNHEPMEFSGDMRYAMPKYKILARELGIEYRELFGPDTELGRWIDSWNTVGIVGKDLFVHAGLGGDYYRWNLPTELVNEKMSGALFMRNADRKALSDTMDFLYGSFGPIWYRGLVRTDEKRRPVQMDTLDLLLDRYGVDHIIVGHTIFDDVSTFYDGKVIDVNVSNPRNMEAGRGRALLIENGEYWVVGDKGRLRRLE